MVPHDVVISELGGVSSDRPTYCQSGCKRTNHRSHRAAYTSRL